MLPFEDEFPESGLSANAICWEGFVAKSIKPSLGALMDIRKEVAEEGTNGPRRTEKASRSQSTDLIYVKT